MKIASVSKHALVVVDMQNDYCHANGVYPRNGLKCFDIENVVNATENAVDCCKALKIPTIYLRMAWNSDAQGYPIDAGLIVDESRSFLREEGLRRGTWGAEVLAPMPEPDYVVDKTRYSGFHNTALEALLRGLSVETICWPESSPMFVLRRRRAMHFTATSALLFFPIAFRLSIAGCMMRVSRHWLYLGASVHPKSFLLNLRRHW